MKKALIVLPTYNEKKNISTLIPHIFDVLSGIKNWKVEVLIVDDNSPDDTYGEALRLSRKYKGLHIIQGEKEGLGTAYVRGFSYGMKKIQPDVMFEMDADGQHDPELIPLFLREIDSGADFVIGSRYIKGGSIPESWTIDRKFYSIVGNLVARLGFMHLSIHDWTSGYRCIKTDFLKNILNSMEKQNGYIFQIALLDKAIKAGLKLKEIPLNFTDRHEGVSKFNSAEFIVDGLLYVFKNSTFVKFVIVGFIGFIIDFGIAAILIAYLNFYKPHANAFSSELAIISNFFLNNFWSFKHKKIPEKLTAYVQKLIHFNIVSSGSIFLQWAGMFLMLNIFGDVVLSLSIIHIPAWIVYKILIIAFLIIPYSYFMYNRFVWKSSN